MAKIKLLPDTLISQIAAGEVVERPASVVKELIENSLDAGADQIVVEIEQGGMRSIVVRDNGLGIDSEDVLLAFARHATSKIETFDDLSRIASFGFRGEALASIGSVAMVTLRTRQQGKECGRSVVYNGGRLVSQSVAGCPTGTEIIVQNLFFNTPARQKFLKAESTEASYVATIVSHMAIANPRVGFELKHNGKTLLSTPRSSGETERLAAILGNDFASEAISVSFVTPSITIRGFIGKPGAALSSKKHQYLFVNSRDVSDAMISRAILDAYGSRLPGRVYPIFAIHVDLDSKDVDVNVHPRKLAVKFVDTNRVYRDVKQAVSQALEQFQDNLFGNGSPSATSTFTTSAFITSAIPDSHVDFSFARAQKRPDGLTPVVENDISRAEQQSSLASSQSFQILGQIADSYILIFKDEGLAIVDQHAAHERILYERLCVRITEKASSFQPLLTPISIECSPQERIFVSDAIDYLKSLGFEIELWSGNTVQISACPAELAKENLTKIFKNFLSEMMEESSQESKQKKVLPERILKSLACKGAIKFGMRIGVEEQQRLISDLLKTPNSSTCPHGRPVQVLVTFDELERRFYRRN